MTALHHLVEGAGPVVLLLHAGVADLRMWGEQVAALDSEHTVVRCDLPGYGGTPVAPGPDSCDAEAVLALLEQLGVERFRLVGASYGGYVALQVASAVPERVERLVLVAPAADLVEPDEPLRELWRQEQALLDAGDLDGAADLALGTWLGPAADEEHRRLLRDMQHRAYELQSAADEQEAPRHLPVTPAAVVAPATVLVGGHDLPFFRSTARALADALPHAELVELPWAGHLPSLERPAETARLVAAALG